MVICRMVLMRMVLVVYVVKFFMVGIFIVVLSVKVMVLVSVENRMDGFIWFKVFVICFLIIWLGQLMLICLSL